MELQLTILFILFIASSLLFIIRHSRDKNKNIPPQPWRLPLVGHIHHLIGQQPHHALGNLAKKLGPVVSLQLGEIPIILISSPTCAKQITKTHDHSFINRPKLLAAEIISYNYTGIGFTPYGDYWRQIRKICILELLSAKKVQSFRSVREQESWKLIEHIAKQRSRTIDLTDKTYTLMNTITIRTVAGRCNDQELLIALIREIVSFSNGFEVTDMFPSIKALHLITGTRNKLLKIRQKIDPILDKIISDKIISNNEERPLLGEATDNEDVVDVLLRLKDDGGLQIPITFDNIKAVIMDLFIGGTDTSTSTLEWAMSELIKKPSVMMKVQAEVRRALKGKKKIDESDIQKLDYLKLVIKETIRLHPALPLLLPRECQVECEIGGYHIPVNTKVMINAWKIGRDPDYWTDPESFIPERFSVDTMVMDFAYIPFGAGRRMCPGMTMALANVELPLAMLLYHFDWDLPNGAASKDLDMNEAFGATLSRKYHLLLVPTPY